MRADRWRAAAPALLWTMVVFSGLFAGVGAYTFRYANGLSYFSADPRACMNCHIMRPQFDAWQKASHHTAATCIECHLPHDLVPKYIAKAENGYRHSKEFTAGTFAEPIVVKARGREILQQNCVRCHAALIAETNPQAEQDSSQSDCVRCHSGVGHGEVARLGGAYRPSEKDPYPPIESNRHE